MAEDEIECLEGLLRNPWLTADMINRCTSVKLSLSKKPPRILARIPVDAQLAGKLEGCDYSVEEERAFCDKSEAIRETVVRLGEIMGNFNLVEYPDEKGRSESALTFAYGYGQG